jgi:hypothetical protein
VVVTNDFRTNQTTPPNLTGDVSGHMIEYDCMTGLWIDVGQFLVRYVFSFSFYSKCVHYTLIHILVVFSCMSFVHDHPILTINSRCLAQRERPAPFPARPEPLVRVLFYYFFILYSKKKKLTIDVVNFYVLDNVCVLFPYEKKEPRVQPVRRVLLVLPALPERRAPLELLELQ